MVALDGNILVVAIPLAHFEDKLCEGWNAMDCAVAAGKFSYDELMDLGGEVQLLRKGQGVVIPPAWMIFQIGAGMLPDQCRPKDESTGSAVFVT